MVEVIRRISPESYIIAAIATLDLVLTIILIRAELAHEGNPIMRYYLSHGIPFLVLAKLIFTAMPILILEWARQYRPSFVRALSRIAIVGYVGFYAVLFVQVNVPTLLAQRNRTPIHTVQLSELQGPEASAIYFAPRPKAVLPRTLHD